MSWSHSHAGIFWFQQIKNKEISNMCLIKIKLFLVNGGGADSDVQDWHDAVLIHDTVAPNWPHYPVVRFRSKIYGISWKNNYWRKNQIKHNNFGSVAKGNSHNSFWARGSFWWVFQFSLLHSCMKKMFHQILSTNKYSRKEKHTDIVNFTEKKIKCMLAFHWCWIIVIIFGRLTSASL